MRLPLLALALGLAAVPVYAQPPLPDLGEAASEVLPPQLERRIGESLLRDIRAREPAYLDDPEVVDYLKRLGARLAAAAAGARRDFEFFVLRDASINAFALPGGFIGVHSGLIAAAESESELASVLAHEMAHVTQRHIARLLGAQQQMQIPVMAAIAAALLLGRSRPDLAHAAAAAAQGVATQASLGYSRDFEREADRIGFQMLTGAGFDGRAMVAFLERLQRAMRLVDDGSVPGYLRTHPVTTERIADMQARAEQLPYRQSADSLDFHLVRARLRAEAGEAHDALAHFAAVVRERRFASEAGALYGLAFAQLRAREPVAAEATLARLRALGAEHPMIELLAARARSDQGDLAGALALLRRAAERWPGRRPVVYAFAKALQDAGRHAESVVVLDAAIGEAPRDARLHELRARGYAGLGRRLAQHRAQAEAYALQGSLGAAIEQLSLALAAGDGDFYELSATEARLRELRAEHAREREEMRLRR